MVAIGGGFGDDELKRLELALHKTVVQALGEKDTPPLAHVLRPVHPAPSAEAAQQEIEHLKEVSKATFEIMELAAGGVFHMPRGVVSGGGKRRKRASLALAAAAGPRPRKARRVTVADELLVSQSFEEAAIKWKIICVTWSAEDEAVVVWYYGILDAERVGLPEEVMRGALNQEVPETFDCVERSSVAEIRKWIKEGALPGEHEEETEGGSENESDDEGAEAEASDDDAGRDGGDDDDDDDAGQDGDDDDDDTGQDDDDVAGQDGADDDDDDDDDEDFAN